PIRFTYKNSGATSVTDATLRQLHCIGTHKKRMSDHAAPWISASELTTLYARRSLSPVEVAAATLERAAKLQPSLNAFVLLDTQGTQAAAKASESRWQQGRPLSPLDGVPTSIKDTTPVKGWPTRLGSHATDETPAKENAPVVDRFHAA